MAQNERNLVRRPCIEYLRTMIELKQLKRYPFLYWTAPPDVGKTRPWIAQQMKLDGYQKGVFDLTIIVADQTDIKAFLVEFKYGKNKYTPEQKTIADSCQETPIQAIKIYSLEEFQAFLKDNL